MTRTVTARTSAILRLIIATDAKLAIGAVAIRAVRVTFPLIAAVFIKLLLDAESQSEAWTAATALAATLSIALVGSWWGSHVDAKLEETAMHSFEVALAEASTAISDLAAFDSADTQDRLELLRDDASSVPRAVTEFVAVAATATRALAATALLVLVSPAFVALLLFGIPSVIASARSERSRQRVLTATAEDVRFSGMIFDVLLSPRLSPDVRTTGFEAMLIDRYAAVSARVVHERFRAWLSWAFWQSTGWAFFLVGFAGALYVAGAAAQRGEFSSGELALLFIVGTQVNGTVAAVATTVGGAVNMLTGIDRYLDLLDLAQPASAESTSMSGFQRHNISLHNVSFTYEGATQVALKNVTIEFRAGSVTAVVGENAAGKTTLTRLLLGLYQPSSGMITVGEHNLSGLARAAWFRTASAAFQDFVRFELRVRDVVGIGDTERLAADPDSPLAALGAVGLGQVVSEFPDGLVTPLGPTLGSSFDPSGGQWQQLAIGRSMMRDRPHLLILDEPTAALDVVSEDSVLRSYAAACQRVARTDNAVVVIVTHRLALARIADRVVVLRNGQVEASGPHDELLATSRHYRRLYESHSSGFAGS